MDERMIDAFSILREKVLKQLGLQHKDLLEHQEAYISDMCTRILQEDPGIMDMDKIIHTWLWRFEKELEEVLLKNKKETILQRQMKISELAKKLQVRDMKISLSADTLPQRILSVKAAEQEQEAYVAFLETVSRIRMLALEDRIEELFDRYMTERKDHIVMLQLPNANIQLLELEDGTYEVRAALRRGKPKEKERDRG